MSPDPLGIIWRCADNPSPLLTIEEIEAIPSDSFKRLTDLGILQQDETASNVTCDACTGQHVEKVEQINYPDDTTRFFITCPENGRVEVHRERLYQWSINYLPLLRALARTLSTSTLPEEAMSRRAWNLGRATLAGKSKPVWAARGLTWTDATSVADMLPKGKSPVLFFIGQPPDDNLLEIPRESIIELRTVVQLNGGNLSIDHNAIKSQLTSDVSQPRKDKKRKKRESRSTTIDALKRELHEYILSMKSRIRQADDSEAPFQLPQLTQKQLAVMIGKTDYSVSRALKDDNDRELKILFDTANDMDQIRKYSS